jgi:hypothetical protein
MKLPVYLGVGLVAVVAVVFAVMVLPGPAIGGWDRTTGTFLLAAGVSVLIILPGKWNQQQLDRVIEIWKMNYKEANDAYRAAAVQLQPPSAQLAEALECMQAIDSQSPVDDGLRNHWTWIALGAAARCGLTVGFQHDPLEPDWPVAFIRLPEGQVSWHTPRFPDRWDGHRADEKYSRVRRFCDAHRADQFRVVDTASEDTNG